MAGRLFVFPLAILIAACGGGSSSPDPRTPTAPTPAAPAPATWSLSGAVTDAVTGQGVTGATLTFTGFSTVQTGAGGAWQLEGTGASPGTQVLLSTISAPGYYERVTRIEWKSGGRTGLALSLLPDRAPFSLDFFRMLVRNAHEEPESLEPLRRWTSNPNFYLNAHNPRTDQKLPPSDIEMIERTVRAVVPQVTGGLLAAGAFDVGVTPRAQREGYININIVYEPSENYCGRAYVGSNPGRITLNYERCRVNWCRDAISANVVAHEVGHAMGLWHVPEGMMIASLNDCRGTTFTEAERLHARIAYLRPVGNLDVDEDPASFRAIAGGAAPEVICRNAPAR